MNGYIKMCEARVIPLSLVREFLALYFRFESTMPMHEMTRRIRIPEIVIQATF